MTSNSILYIVATPIGNLEDMTLRAIRILKEVDLILCEDTRTTKKLLNHYAINTPTMSYHANSTLQKESKIIEMLQEGKNLALVSDAGTPCISDPGVKLVAEVKKQLGNDCQVIPIPGASALISALSASGIPSSEFIFYGFLPHKKGRETLFKEIAQNEKTSVFYESSHRIMKTLETLPKILEENRTVVVARELTKIYEQFVEGSSIEVLEYFTKNEDKVRGEFVVIIKGK